jgi:hypothetical protein
MTAKRRLLALVAGGICLYATEASAATVDFSDLENTPYTLGNNGVVPQTFGDESGTVDFSYRSLHEGNHWGQGAILAENYVNYWADGNFSNDDAIHAVKHNEKMEIRLDAGPGLILTNVLIHLGGRPNTDQEAHFKAYDSNWNVLSAASDFFVSGATGALLALAPNSTSLVFQLGSTWDVGVNWLSYETAAADVPLPAGAVFLLTGLLGVGGAGRLRKAA